jgi:ABC-type polar amino acid transport system ATPase subunit
MAPRMNTLDVADLALSRGARTIVDGLSFAVRGGELVVLMGASGTGKSTVLRAVAGLDPIQRGCITVNGVRLDPGLLPRGERLRALHRNVGMVFQFHHLFANMTARENVMLAPTHVLRQPRADVERQAQTLLESLGVGHRADAMPAELSGGEAQRVAIARALAVDPPLLLMDEPTASLDPARRSDLAATLRQLADKGRALVVATHDREFARVCADRVLLLEHGRVHAADV